MSKSVFTILSLLFIVFTQTAQSQNHVKWAAHFDKSSSELVITASIDKGWHLYSINNAEDLGPVPTHIRFEKMRGLKIIGKTIEQEPINAFDPNFGTNVAYHEDRVEFRQKMKIKKHKMIKFSVFYMVCDDSQCLPPIEVSIAVDIN